MFIEVIDSLRCVRAHDESWLVAAITTMAGRDIREGSLGCPVCGAEYAIREGVAIFDPGAPPNESLPRNPHDESDADAAMRCAALLGLFDSGGIALLGGVWARSARAMLDIAQVAILVVGPPRGLILGTGVSEIRVGEVLPLATGSVRGVALDEHTCSTALVAGARRALVPGGRLVAPVTAAIPDGMIERARDDEHWVAEAAPVPAPVVPLTVRRAR